MLRSGICAGVCALLQTGEYLVEGLRWEARAQYGHPVRDIGRGLESGALSTALAAQGQALRAGATIDCACAGPRACIRASEAIAFGAVRILIRNGCRCNISLIQRGINLE